jgi:hypothetical protein
MPMEAVPEMYGPPPQSFNDPPGPSPGEQIGAGFRGSSIIYSAARALAMQGFEPQDGYAVKWDDIKDNPSYVAHAPEFAASVSPAHTDMIRARIDHDEADQRIRAASGLWGTIGSLVGNIDPTLLLPGRVLVGTLKDGMPFARSALEVGAAGGLQAAAQEPFRFAGDPSRTGGEAAVSIASTTILGGLLGGAGAWLFPGEAASIAGKMDRERAAADAHVMGQPAPAGAAATDTRTMEDLTPVGAYGLEKLRDNAVTRTLLKGSLAARRAATRLAETAVLVKANLEGRTTTLDGEAPIETMARTQQQARAQQIYDAVHEGWTQTAFEGAVPRGAKLRDEIRGLWGTDLTRLGGKISFEDFSKQVGDAVMFGVKHDNPLVQQAAEKAKAVFDEYSGRAEQSVDGFKRAEQYPDESYFPHMWNKALIQARRPEFVDKLTEKYATDQAANAATQERVRTVRGSLDQREANIKKYTQQLEKAQEDLELSEELRDEVRRQNKFGYQTAERMRESSYENVGGIREAAPEKNIEKARGGALFETQIRARGNKLAEDALRHRNKVADLEEKLQNEHASAAAMRAKLEEEIGKWHGQSHQEAMSAIKAREKYEAEREAKRTEGEPKGGRLTSADEAVDKAAQRIMESAQSKTPQELRDDAEDATWRILGSPDGRLPYDESGAQPRMPPGAAAALRGSLHERALDVSNAFAHDWIERDINKVMSGYMRTFVPDVLLAERFGDAEMTNEFRKISEDYQQLIDANRGNEKEVTRLGKERDDAIKDVAMLRDRIRGLYNIPKNEAQRRIGRIAAAVRNYNVWASMGLAAISSIPDTAGVIFRWGMGSTFNDAWVPFIKSMMTDRKYAKEVIRQFQVMHIANETITATRHHELNGIVEPYAQGSTAERTLQYGADKMQMLNLMAPMTDIQKVWAATVASTGLYRAAKRAAEGKATKLDLLQLGQANVPQRLWETIVEQYEKRGNEVDGHMLPNTEDWTHKEARSVFEAAIHRDVNLAVVTPGIDKPAFLSDPVLGVLTQFKSFTAAATTRILVANLQRSDAHTLQGVIASLGFGVMAYYVHAVATGTPLSNNPSDYLKEGISRGNLTGWLDEANNFTSKATRGRVDVYRALGATPGTSRDAGRSAVESLMGPTFGKLVNLSRATGAMASGNYTAADINATRRVMGGNNLWFLNRALTEAEKSLGNALGVPQQAQH